MPSANLTPTAVVYEELQQAFDHFNAALFDAQLRACLITLQRQNRTAGYFSLERFVNAHGEMTDEIALNPSYFGIRPIRDSLSTLVHEMCHLWQYQHGKPGRRAYHNKEWAEKMEEIGLMPSHTGEPGGKRVGEQMTHYIIDGGAFCRACVALIDQSYQLTWLDRFPPPNYQPPSGRSKSPGAAPGSEGGEDPADKDIIDEPQGPAAMAWTDEDDEEIAKLKPYLVEPSAKPSSNRLKYRCPICEAQVWGKPGLSLICGGEGCEKARFDVV